MDPILPSGYNIANVGYKNFFVNQRNGAVFTKISVRTFTNTRVVCHPKEAFYTYTDIS
jgi:hypothetical protein